MAHRKHHRFHHTHIEHHDDGSMTIHHEAHIPADDVKHAVGDLDGVHDSLEEHLGLPNDDEEAEEAGAAGQE